MKILVVEDDFISRKVLTENLSEFGICHAAMNGLEMLTAVEQAFQAREPYDLICLDIMMPEMDGRRALKEMRRMEKEKGIGGSAMTKVIMTTALSDPKTVMDTIMQGGCEAYLTKPIEYSALKKTMADLGLI